MCVVRYPELSWLLPQNKRTGMWANDQRDGRPADYRWHPLFNAESLADADYYSAVR